MRSRLYPFAASKSVAASSSSTQTIEMPPEAVRIESLRLASSESVITPDVTARIRESTGEALYPRSGGFHPVAGSVEIPVEVPVSEDDEILSDFKNDTASAVDFGVVLGVRLR